jgi:hypothetical protein
VDINTVVVTFSQSCVDDVTGPWTFEVERAGVWSVCNVTGVDDTFTIRCEGPAQAGDRWRVLTDNGQITWLSPAVAIAVPESGILA